jgi:hypothetical protein
MKPLVRADDISPPGGVEPAGKLAVAGAAEIR